MIYFLWRPQVTNVNDTVNDILNLNHNQNYFNNIPSEPSGGERLKIILIVTNDFNCVLLQLRRAAPVTSEMEDL